MTLTSTRTRFAPPLNVGRCSCGAGGVCASSAATHVSPAATDVMLASAGFNRTRVSLSQPAAPKPPHDPRAKAASNVERGDDRRMVAGSHVALHDTASDALEHRAAGEHVIQPPPDIALAHVPPGGPPREHLVVLRLELATGIDEPAGENALEHRAFFRQLPDRARLPLLRVHVDVGAGDIDIPADQQGRAVREDGGHV